MEEITFLPRLFDGSKTACLLYCNEPTLNSILDANLMK